MLACSTRSRKRSSFLLLLCLCISGCRTRLLSEAAPTTEAVDASQPPVDFTLAPLLDLASSDMGPCNYEEYGVVPLTRIELVDPAGAHHLGALIRLKLVFPMGACDYVATAGESLSPGNATDGVTFTTYLWRRRGGGPECARIAFGSRVMNASDFPLSSPRLFAMDGAPGGTATLEVRLGPRPIANCDPILTIGQPCQLSCQCAQPGGHYVQCLPIAPGQGVCAHACAEDSECVPGLPLCDAAASPPFTCTPARPDGSCPHECAFGTSCQAGACRAEARPASGKCHCNEDCAGQQYCDITGICFVPCFSVASCPAGANYSGYGKCGFP